ncbi:uncharacterized protein LOC127096383 [Lathyrus oleraceus]|uniref:uncharacterized protein LOC127096383 n=1 Tax=Pisum sativum TaxID=3888 RepID=UPI0021D27EE0|nr:uncharacterized protein LOC127096383 [Pisum sativum]
MRKARTSALRKGKPSKVSTYSSPSMTARNVKTLEPSTTVKKPRSMTSLYLDPIIVGPNVGISKDCHVITNVMEDVEASETSNIPRYTNVVSDVSTSLAQPDNTTETPMDKSDVNVTTLSPEKLKDKESFEWMTCDLANKDENSIEKKDQHTNIVNIEDLGSDDVPIGQRLALGIAKRLKNRKGQVIESSSTPSKSIRKRASDNISTTKKQASGKKILANIPEVRIDNISFHSVENVEKWKFVYQRRLTLERELSKDAFDCKEECDNKRSKEFRKVYVRGRCVDFSPEIINRFLGRNEEEPAEIEVSDNVIYKEITSKQVKEWPRKGKLFISSLSVKYVVLHRIGAANWVPTNHTFNIITRLGKFIYIVGTKSSFEFGSYVFDQTMKRVASYAVKMPIVFPSLICGVILSQHPSILINSDNTCKRDPSLSLYYRFFPGKYVLDIAMTSGQTPFRPTYRTCILVELKDTCKTLDETINSYTERKNKIEMLIKALSEEEGSLKGDGMDEEEEKEEGSDASDDEDATSNDED